MFEIRFSRGAIADLKALSRFRRAEIMDAIERQLIRSPLSRTRNRKEVIGLIPPWEQALPVWELRIGEYRVFYDVDAQELVVKIEAVRRKGRKSTGEIP